MSTNTLTTDQQIQAVHAGITHLQEENAGLQAEVASLQENIASLRAELGRMTTGERH